MIVSVYNNNSLDISKMCDRFCFRVKERSKKRKPSSFEIQLIPFIDSGFRYNFKKTKQNKGKYGYKDISIKLQQP